MLGTQLQSRAQLDWQAKACPPYAEGISASAFEYAGVLAEPSQFDGSEAGMSFVFKKGTLKVSTTF
jgi:hypothetical protein